MAKAWLSGGRVVTDAQGRVLLCDACPCGPAAGSPGCVCVGAVVTLSHYSDFYTGTGTGSATFILTGVFQFNPLSPNCGSLAMSGFWYDGSSAGIAWDSIAGVWRLFASSHEYTLVDGDPTLSPVGTWVFGTEPLADYINVDIDTSGCSFDPLTGCCPPKVFISASGFPPPYDAFINGGPFELRAAQVQSQFILYNNAWSSGGFSSIEYRCYNAGPDVGKGQALYHTGTTTYFSPRVAIVSCNPYAWVYNGPYQCIETGGPSGACSTPPPPETGTVEVVYP